MRTTQILALICVVVACVEGFGVNNFRFIGKNTLFGDKLPQRIKISGTYFLEPDDYEEYNLNHRETFFTNGTTSNGDKFSIDLLKGTGPWLCTKMVANKLASLSQANFDTIEANVNKLGNAVTIGTGAFDFEALSPEPPISVSDCTAITITPFKDDSLLEDDYKGRIFSFEVTHEFIIYGPILFVDYFGAATFIYKQKLQAQDQMRSAGNPLRFCSGTNYNTMIYTPEPRPVCPSEMAEKRTHEKGVLTVFKPNIVPVTKRVGRCSKITTKVYSVSSFVFCCYKNKWGTRTTTNEPMSDDDCREMFINGRTPDGETLQDKDPNATTHSTHFTDRDKSFDFGGYGSNTRNVVDYQLDISIMKITTPSMTISTPWTSIPRNFLYSSSYKTDEYSLVWDQFQPSKLCMFVPRITTEVEAVRYPRGDALMEESSSSDAKETIFFTSRSSMAAWDVDDTMEITDLSKFNCIKKRPGEKIYLNKNGDLLKWHPAKKLRKAAKDPDNGADKIGSDQYDYAHSSYTELVKNEQGTVTVTDDATQNTVSKPSDSSVIDAANFTAPEQDTKPKVNSITDIIKPTNSDTTTTRELLSYMNYQNIQQQNENVHQRLINNCKQNQVAWDVYTAQMELSPSLAIGKHLKRAVEAMYAGNGYYAVKECEIVQTSAIFGTMMTNSTRDVLFNGVYVPFRELVAKLAILPSKNKCLSSPLVKFTIKNRDEEMVGQLMRDGRINVGKIKALEDCLPNRVMAFNVGVKTYFFLNYEFLTNAATETVMKMKSSIEQGSVALTKVTSVGDLSPLTEFINSLVLINIVDPLKEKKFKHTPVGSVNGGQMNSLYEKAAGQSSVLDLMYENSRSTHAARVWKETHITDYSGGVGGGFLNDLADLAESSVDALITLADGAAAGTANLASELGTGIGGLGQGIGDGIAGLGQGVGDGVAGLGEGVGEGVASVGDGLGQGIGALGSGLGGIFTTILLPIIVIAGVAVGGYFFYTKFIAKSPSDSGRRKKTDEDDDEDDQQEEEIYNSQQQLAKKNSGGLINRQYNANIVQQNNQKNMMV